MCTSIQQYSSSQESALYDDVVLREIEKHVDINNLPILEEEVLCDRKNNLMVKSDSPAVEQFSMSPLSQITYNLIPIQTNMDIPIQEEFPGQYNFELLLTNQGAARSYSFSQKLRKVFIDMEQTLPLKFKWDPPVNGLWLRTAMVFTKDEDRMCPVHRCHNHIATNSISNQNMDQCVLRHVVRCTHPDSIYEENNGHMSVSVPLGTPQAGCFYVPLGFQFFCKNSCSSGMNRRKTELVFTLETNERLVLGRRILKVRVCSCPKRDKDKEEQESTDSSNSKSGKKRKRTALQRLNFNQPSAGKKLLYSSHVTSAAAYDTREYNISIRIPGRHNARNILNYAFNHLAGEAVRTGTHQFLSPYMEEIDKKVYEIK